MLMLTGLTYEEALKQLRGDEPIHHLLPGYMVQLILAQMMDGGTLDFTPWSKYLPEQIIWMQRESGPGSESRMVAGWRNDLRWTSAIGNSRNLKMWPRRLK
ncbi:hypothetical protein PHMEG_00021414 [Phytophthora megakarya]|uniref:Uncharacterized protein n=1 Tax=Phytophthora megakarya TaxID=4795 RepID=A0A225VMU1_9STRA|nr:hypothetical protein PHMEG_00021414 [Phytophthora megakarya]